MPSLHTSLAWAVPVDIEVVGPNVEAFIKLQPTITALRLCNRFGHSGAPISRLPAELLSNIEEMLVGAEREKQRHAWEKDYLCFRQRCSLGDHFTDEDLDEYRFDMGFCACGGGCGGGEWEEESLMQSLLDSGVDSEVHHERLDSWTDRVEILSGRAPLLTKFFGLSVWASTVRLSRKAQDDPYYAAEMTMAYLRLPNAPSIKSTMEYSERESDSYDMPFAVETACAMDVTEHMSRPKDAEKRFKRAMRILDLEPYEDGNQEGCTAGLGEEEDPERRKKSWPRLTVLTRTGS